MLVVSSSGGHLTEVRQFREMYAAYEHSYVLNSKIQLPADMVGKTDFIQHAERNWRVLINFWEAWVILRRLRPDLILSTGAGPVVPFGIVGRYLFGCRVVFVETFTHIHTPSLSGKIMYFIANDFFYQWRSLAKFFPKGRYCGPVV